MRIALIYPPPWKIPEPGQPPDRDGGPPREYRDGDLDGDFYQTPYGLFALAAGAKRAGHQVKVINLSAYPWRRAEQILRGLEADVYGLSCWTANRRGVALAAKTLKKAHKEAHIVVGGPHASPLAEEMLSHYPAIDSVTVGESDRTFLEIVDRAGAGRSLRGTPGAVYRVDGKIERGPARGAIADLDELASPHDYFDTHIFMTSRGCPWACTFCGAESQWGRGFRANSVGYVLDALEKLVARLPVKMVLIKDDTFTTNGKRVLELCRGIRERGLRFLWSCDTRVDVLSDELLREMRLAGCQRLSLGVESGSAEILKNIDKKITTAEIIASTDLAKKYGIEVRYFMMLGNRGETRETFHETLDFLQLARPHKYLFSCLSIYPGTRDFEEAKAQGWLDAEAFFEGDFQELKVPFDASDDDAALMNDWFKEHGGLEEIYRPAVEDCKRTLEALGDHHAAHVDLGAAYYHEGELDLAEEHMVRAIDFGFPLPGLALNYLACIAAKRGDFDRMMELFSEAAQKDPQHYSLIKNVNAARAWFKEGGPARGLPLELSAYHDFELLERTIQPTLPGPLPDDFDVWSSETAADEGGKAVARAGSQAPLRTRRHLRVT